MYLLKLSVDVTDVGRVESGGWMRSLGFGAGSGERPSKEQGTRNGLFVYPAVSLLSTSSTAVPRYRTCQYSVFTLLYSVQLFRVRV